MISNRQQSGKIKDELALFINFSVYFLLALNLLIFVSTMFAVFCWLRYHNYFLNPMGLKLGITAELPVSPTPRHFVPHASSTPSPPSTSSSFLGNTHQHTTTSPPEFWEFNAAGYCHSIELIFHEHNVTSELSKYSLLIQALSKSSNILKRIFDSITTLDTTTPYTTLLQRFTAQSFICLQTVLYRCHRHNSTVSEYLTRLHAPLGEHYDANSSLHQDLIRHKLLESLDPQTRLCLYHYKDGPLDALAKHAD